MACVVTHMAVSLAISLLMLLNWVMGSPRSLADAAAYSSARAAVIRVAMSASLNWMAWNSLIGLPHWRLSAAYAVETSRAAHAMPIDGAEMPSRPLSSDCMA